MSTDDRKFSKLLPEDALMLFNMYSKVLFNAGKLYQSPTDDRILTSLSAIAAGDQEVINTWNFS